MVRDHSGKLRMLRQGLMACTQTTAAPACWKTYTSTVRPFFIPQPLTITATKQPIYTAASNIRIQRSPLENEMMGKPGYIHRAFSHWALWICALALATLPGP